MDVVSKNVLETAGPRIGSCRGTGESVTLDTVVW